MHKLGYELINLSVNSAYLDLIMTDFSTQTIGLVKVLLPEDNKIVIEQLNGCFNVGIKKIEAEVKDVSNFRIIIFDFNNVSIDTSIVDEHYTTDCIDMLLREYPITIAKVMSYNITDES